MWRSYEIKVAGELSQCWSDWFDGMTVSNGDDGTAVLRGPLLDQAALHGVLAQIRDLNLRLISLREVSPKPAAYV